MDIRYDLEETEISGCLYDASDAPPCPLSVARLTNGLASRKLHESNIFKLVIWLRVLQIPD